MDDQIEETEYPGPKRSAGTKTQQVGELKEGEPPPSHPQRYGLNKYLLPSATQV